MLCSFLQRRSYPQLTQLSVARWAADPFHTCREPAPATGSVPLVIKRFIRIFAEKLWFLSLIDKLKSLLKPE